jgi:hypothetical protein
VANIFAVVTDARMVVAADFNAVGKPDLATSNDNGGRVNLLIDSSQRRRRRRLSSCHGHPAAVLSCSLYCTAASA